MRGICRSSPACGARTTDMETRAVRYKKEHRRQNLWRWFFGSLIGVALVLFVLLVWFSPVYVADPSMQATLCEGDTVLYDRLYKHLHTLARSDIVAFRDPESGALLLKRIVALAGETVEAKDGMVIIDGKYALKESDYVGDAVFDMAAVTVPDGCVFVLSDDRNYGEDSRNAAIGCIDTDAILGVVKIRLNRFTVFVRG